MKTLRLQDKVALITGGTSGIGRATVELFVREGAQVAFTGRRRELGAALARQSGAVYIPADHRRNEDCAHAVDMTRDAFGRIDILFNNAGIVVSGNAESTSEQDWYDTLELNITAVWRMSKLVLPLMRLQGGGVIVNNASDWGLVGGHEAFAYCASKGAVVQMTKAMALDHAHEQIRVNAVCPGDTFVERWVQNGYFRAGEPVDEAAARQSDSIPLGRVGEVEEIAQAVLFLASDEASFITGTTLVVDGGNTAQ
ncbi:MAG TPA: SDR family oxidoreductase [Anaerolineales bacterium]|nr:SDR family oxidoreductase [Anaerolineales bacterium]